MDLAPCPFCHLPVPSSELEWHANNHFLDEHEQQRLASDLELAQQIAFAPPSPPSLNSQVISDLPFDLGFEEKVNCLINFQSRSIFHKVEHGLMALLRKCLELESDNTTSILSGYVDHFQSLEYEDVGWGCGWRNIQMLSSHLLHQRQEEVKKVLFGGQGFIPDIPSLQRWLEIAWEKGFDEPGSEHFDGKIYGLKKWIGTTECAALLRSFGLKAMIVDFGPKEFESLYLSVPGSSAGVEGKSEGNGLKRRGIQVCGPMDRYVVKKIHGHSQAHSGVQEKSSSSSNITRENEGQQVLIDWIWNYFSDSNKPGNGHVIVSDKAPLYFQHDGHSRTIVGIQIKHQRNGVHQHNLLILDPAHRTAALEKSLKEKVGWQKLIKRGVHTLKKPQYQLCYVEPGIASGEEMELLKTISSVFLEL
ncbi:uncharacterized protein LOC133834338 [Humulus lupulus]|uniref:uncharacterized protein LOC133834338 n=1 Tax=Humulus lupulus TaxID=3486 RepID=UPI002B410514|nr:uncharacterized protein LOC133834338 [Humulus lupulus]